MFPFVSYCVRCHSPANEMVLFRDSFAFNLSLRSLILSENIARPFLRISSAFGAMAHWRWWNYWFVLFRAPEQPQQRITVNSNASDFNTIQI